MPAETAETRRCPRCRESFPADRDHFYVYPSTGRLEYCLPNNCHRDYWRERSRARRAGRTMRFGVEIEFIGDRYAVKRACRAEGLTVAAENYNHAVRSYWKVITDASVARGGELVSPPLRGADGRRQVERACRALSRAGATVNRSCGLHVHHDMSGFDAPAIGRVFRSWMSSQGAIDTLVARSRRGVQWAAPLTEGEVRYIERLPGTARQTVRDHFTSFYFNRYRSLNVTCYPRYGTIEVRQHQGTTSARKILAWVEFGQAFLKAARRALVQAPSTAQLLDALRPHGLSEPTHGYLHRRALTLNAGRRARPTTTTWDGRDENRCNCYACRTARTSAYGSQEEYRSAMRAEEVPA